jgi:hypothetical protein
MIQDSQMIIKAYVHWYCKFFAKQEHLENRQSPDQIGNQENVLHT